MKIKDEKYISHCLLLAEKGLSDVGTNPMVGSVIVFDDKIIGKGYHKKYGGAHAEVIAINSVLNKKLLSKATLYVNLEPCSHFGKTPPCVDLIIKNKIPRVIIGCLDVFNKVNGKGIQKLKKAGVDVKVSILEDKCKNLNKTFFTYHQKKRPYIILKWAETKDKFIDKKRNISDRKNPLLITNNQSQILTHTWRSQVQAIMIGTNTALLDNPQLTTRKVKGKNPLRIVIDRDLKIPKKFHLLDNSTPTIVFAAKNVAKKHNLEFIKINFHRHGGASRKNIILQILKELYRRNIQSLMIEGGAQLLNSFIKNNLWDEMRIFTGNKKIKNGTKAPIINLNPTSVRKIGYNNKLKIYENKK